MISVKSPRFRLFKFTSVHRHLDFQFFKFGPRSIACVAVHPITEHELGFGVSVTRQNPISIHLSLYSWTILVDLFGVMY